MTQLETYFSDEESWECLVALAEPYRGEDDVAALTARLNNNTDVAAVIYVQLRRQSLAWIERTVPALGGLSAIECCADGILVNRLKEMLMRMP